jgi:hypothetical protein
VIAIYPSLRLSANGAVALLDGVEGGFRLVAIPDLTVQVEESYGSVVDVTLSAFGGSLGMRTTDGDVVVIRGSDRRRHPLPHPYGEIRAIALSDRGDRLGLLLADSLETWSLPPESAPSARIDVPPVERGFLTANPSFTHFGVFVLAANGDGPQFRGLYRGSHGDALSPVWQERGTALASTSIALSDEWVWVARADGLVGWRGGDPPVTLPGTGYESLIFSPTGGHLLAWRIERLNGVTGADVLFRLIDLTSLTETARTTYPVDQIAEAHPALAPDLSLLIVRAARDGRVTIEHRALPPL